MAKTIQNVPEGLLELLDMKSGGSTPIELLDAVRNTIDVTNLYAAAQLDTVQTLNGAVAVPGDIADAVVPNDEFWLVYQAAAILSPPAIGDSGQSEVSIQAPGGAGLVGIPMAQSATVAATTVAFQSIIAPVSLPVPYVLRPGDVIRARASQFVSAANGVLTINVRMARLGRGARG